MWIKRLFFLLISSFLVMSLVACEKNKSEKDKSGKTETAAEKYYKLDNDEVLVELNGAKLTVGEVKKRAFEQLYLTEINKFIERQLILQKYPVSDEELKKEMEQYGGSASPVDKEELRYRLAYDKAIRDGMNITEEDLKKIYDENFKDSGLSYEEMKKDLEKMAPYYMNNDNYYKKLSELRKSAKPNFYDKELKKEIDSMFGNNYN